jgi:hypothetical protein
VRERWRDEGERENDRERKYGAIGEREVEKT